MITIIGIEAKSDYISFLFIILISKQIKFAISNKIENHI